MPCSNKYRKNVCAVIFKKNSKKVLICHRKGFNKKEGWQFPQGGIRKGKDLISEVKRELLEEIGTNNIKIIKISKKSYKYKFPPGIKHKKNYIGQSQKWIIAEFLGKHKDINFKRQPSEFDDYRWVKLETVIKNIVDFKRKVYIRALKDFGLININ